LISTSTLVTIAEQMRRVLLCALFFAVSGCGAVKPWERGALAHRTMDSKAGDRYCSESFLGHTYDVREGASGGTGKAGGGCGCN
jgi:hypothetical protein